MMQAELRITFEARNAEEEEEQFLAAAQGVVCSNLWWMRRQKADGKEYPCCLGCAGVRYEEPQKCDAWCQIGGTASVILRRKRATCLGIAAYQTAVLRSKGEDANLCIYPVQDTYGKVIPHYFHFIVEREDGTFDDPTKELIESPGGCPVQCSAKEAV